MGSVLVVDFLRVGEVVPAGFPLGGGGGACWIGAGLRTAVGGFCTGGGFPPDGGGGTYEVEACTGADKGGVELI